MSGGELVIAPTVAAGGGVSLMPILAVAGGVVAAGLVVWAAVVGTGAAGRALERFGNEMARLADAQDDAAIRARLWEAAAGAVAHTNQELRLLAARAAKVGIRPDLPPFLDLTGCALADTRALVTQAQDALAAARLEVVRAEARQAKQALLTQLSVAAGDLPTTADLIAEYKKAQAHRWTTLASGSQLPVPPPLDESKVHAEIDKILLRLDPDAMADEREQVLMAAARAEQKAANAATGRTYLEALRRMVDTVVNPKVGRRREAAGLLAGLTHPVLTAMMGELPPPQPPFLGSIDRLNAVVSGDEDLSDDDRQDAQAALAWAQAKLDQAQREQDRRRLQDRLVEAFTGLGYSVSEGLQVHHPGALSITRASWDGEYTADVWIDADTVHTRLVQVAPDAVGEASRCAELNADLHRAGAALARHEIDVDVELPAHHQQALTRIDPRPARKSRDRGTGPKYRHHDPTQETR